MSIRCVAIDMDGTTFDNQGVISQDNIEAIRRACRQGVLIVPATGRAFHEVPKEIYNIAEIQWFVVSNGAVVSSRAGDVIHTDQIGYDTAVKIMGILERYDVMTELYLDGRPVAEKEKMTDDCFRYYNIEPKYFSVLRESRTGVDNVAHHLQKTGTAVEKFNLFFKDLGERAAFMADMAAFKEEVEITSSMTNNLEINKKGSNKGAGLAHLCRRLRIKPEEVLAMGDSDNDLTMLRYAGTAVAVENACPLLKREANHMTVSNDESAVAEVLKNFVFEP